MPRKILVTSALPYANAPLHLGHILEAIQTDIWVRFQRMRGNDCLLLLRRGCARHADHDSRPAGGHNPRAADRALAAEHQRDYDGFLIGHDQFHSTHSHENRHFTRAALHAPARCRLHRPPRGAPGLRRAGEMFLPDRYVRGICPRCKSAPISTATAARSAARPTRRPI